MSKDRATTGLFRKRDYFVVFLVTVTLLFCIDKPALQYSLEPSWFIDQKTVVNKQAVGNWTTRSVFTEIRSDNAYNRLKPFITDLDGDGNKELIAISKDFAIKVYNWDIPNVDEGDIYHPQEQFSLNLPMEAKKTPIMMKSGYIARYEETKARHQIIVVVYDDWTVECYDSSLNLLWEKTLGKNSKELSQTSLLYTIDDLSIHISPLNLRSEQSDVKESATDGVVIVGASMKLREHPLTAEFKSELQENRTSEQLRNHLEMELRSELEHFTIYALEGSRGHVIWRHDGTDVRTEQYSRSLPQHAYDLDLSELMTKAHHAAGMNDWTVFRQSLMDELPHTWMQNCDTSMRFAHFVRRHVGAGAGDQVLKKDQFSKRKSVRKTKTVFVARNQKSASSASKKERDSKAGAERNVRSLTKLGKSLRIMRGLDGYQPLSAEARLPHDAEEHEESPNVLVAHTRSGIEVVSLRAGTPITSLALNAFQSYDDLNGDGIIDTIIVIHDGDMARSVETQQQRNSAATSTVHICMMIVLSGLPTRSQLFNGTVCNHRGVSGAETRYGHGGHRRRHPQREVFTKISYSPPLFLRKFDASGEMEGKEKDVLVAVNNGYLTSYGGSGHLNWQLKVAPTWSNEDNAPAASNMVRTVHYDADARRVDESLSGHDNLHANVLVMGDKEMQLVSRDGSILTSVGLPKSPVHPPLLSDFNDDGVIDVIVLTNDAILGYQMTVHQSTHGTLILLLLVCVATVIIFVSNIQVGEEEDKPMERLSTSINLKSKGKMTRFLKLIRSTDDDHLD